MVIYLGRQKWLQVDVSDVVVLRSHADDGSLGFRFLIYNKVRG